MYEIFVISKIRDFWGFLRDLGFSDRFLRDFKRFFLAIFREFLEFLGIVWDFLQGFLDFSIRFLFGIFAKVYEIFSSDVLLV